MCDGSKRCSSGGAYSSGSGGSVDNIGFAIPIDKAEDSLKELMNLPTREKVDPSEASYLGIEGETITPLPPVLQRRIIGAVRLVNEFPVAVAAVRVCSNHLT